MSSDVNEKIVEEVYEKMLQHSTPEAVIRWELDRNQIMQRMTDGCAIVTHAMTLVWANERFYRDFPKAQSGIGSEQNILSIMDNPAFSNMDDEYENDSEYLDEEDFNLRVPDENEKKNPNPFSEFLTTSMPAKSMMSCKENRTFEVEVYPWNHPVAKEKYMLLVVHDATKRQELKNQLKNIHNVCEGLSHIDALRECSPEQRWDSLKEGVQYMSQDLFHYEFLEMRLYDPGTEMLQLWTYYGLEKEAIQRTPCAKETKNGTIGYVATTHKTYICRDTETDAHYLRGGGTARSSMTIPILFLGELLGILNVESSKPDAFDEQDKLYGEILAHEIANAMNIIRLLDTEKLLGIQTSVEVIHSKIALPCREIEKQVLELTEHITSEQIEAQHSLYKIIINAQKIYGVILEVGQKLAPQVIDPDMQELAERWGESFQNKRILLIGVSDREMRHAQEIFTLLKCELHSARTGKEALAMLEFAKQNGSDYYAILSTIKLEGYERATQFFIDLAHVYGKTHPPLVLLQESCTYNPEHTIPHVRARYPATTSTCIPFVFNVLLSRIDSVVQNAPTTKTNFLKFEECYNDPFGMTLDDLKGINE